MVFTFGAFIRAYDFGIFSMMKKGSEKSGLAGVAVFDESPDFLDRSFLRKSKSPDFLNKFCFSKRQKS